MNNLGKTREWLPHFGFTIVYILWGMNISSMKIGGHEWDALTFNGLRFLSASPILWAYTWWYYRKRGLRIRMSGKDLLLNVVLGLCTALALEALLAYALQYSNAANGAVLGRGAMPIVTVIISLLLGQLRPTWRMAVGLPVAFAGVLLIVASGESGLHFGPSTIKGDVLLLMRSVFGALYLIGMSRLVHKYPLPLLLAIEVTTGAIALLPYVLWKVDTAYLAGMSVNGWISLAYTTIFATLIGFSVHNWSLGRLGAYKASVYGYLLPVTAAVGGIFIIGESVSSGQAAGAIGVLGAMYLVQRDRMQSSSIAVKKHVKAAEA